MKQDDSVEIIKRATADIIRAKELVNSRFGIGPGKIKSSEKEVGRKLLELPDDVLITLLSTMKGEF